MNTCATCKHFQFKYSGDYSWGQCLQPQMLNRDIMQIKFDPPRDMTKENLTILRQDIRNYGRVYFREDMFGCILHEVDALEQIAQGDERGRE